VVGGIVMGLAFLLSLALRTSAPSLSETPAEIGQK
jgi:hypothetical protein